MARAENQFTSMVDQVEPLNRDLSGCEEAIRKAKRDIDHYLDKKEEYAGKARVQAATLQKKARERDAAVARAKELGDITQYLNPLQYG